MLHNNQISLIVLLIIIGVTLYLLSCDNSDKPLKNLGELVTNSMDDEGNQIVSHVDDVVLNQIINDDQSSNAEVIEIDDSEVISEEEVRSYADEEEVVAQSQRAEYAEYAEYAEDAKDAKDAKEESAKPTKRRSQRHKNKKKTNASEIELDKYFDNCALNGGNLYNDNDFAPAQSDTAGASINVAYKPSPLNPNTCTDCIDFNGTSNNPNTKYQSKDYLPQEVNNTWFETDLSNAKYDVNNNKLINTDKFAIGINTVGQSLKNPSYDIRGTIPNPKITVSPWMQSTIEPDFNIASLY